MTIPANHDEAGIATPLAPRGVHIPTGAEQSARDLAHDLAHLANLVGNLAYLLDLHATDPVAVRRDAERLADIAERGAVLADRLTRLEVGHVSAPRDTVSAPRADVSAPGGTVSATDAVSGSRSTVSDRGGRASAAGVGVGVARPLHVLVVEDEVAGRELMAALLVGAGHRVTAAAGVREALRALDHPRNRLDAIITDVGLDDGDGWELVELARQRRPGLRIGVVTGWRDPARLRGAEHADFVVGKPFRLDELLAHLGD